MLCAKLLSSQLTASGRRISSVRPYRLPANVIHDGGEMASETPGIGGVLSYIRQYWQELAPAASLHSQKLQTPGLQQGAPKFSTAGTTSRFDKGPPESPDISLLSPELQQQWHVDRNMHLGAVKVTPYSTVKAVWKCDHCPAGQPHVWTTAVRSRRKGTKCPYCSNRRLCWHNSLATIAPDVAQYWDHTKNEKSPEQSLAGSHTRAEWKCPACKYEWKASINRRASASFGCPKCSQASKITQSQPTFAEAQPAELAEWDYERNEAEGFYLHEVTLGSAKRVHWICSRCPGGQPHRWTATPAQRVGNGTGCAVCHGRKPCVCNSLESLLPSIAAEFDVDKNGFAPSEITAWSNKKVWWRNAKRGSWRQAVYICTKGRLPSDTQQV
ncbi:hypothetical protein ABBQ38_001838 [Trebouxia sp. C0009 RCD-2024]